MSDNSLPEMRPDTRPDALAAFLIRYLTPFLDDGAPVQNLHARVIAEVERPLFRLVLQATDGNQIRAAAILGLNRNTLRKRLRDLEIEPARCVVRR
ncbi:hypothetical protein AA101099_2499 [Neoasaia chiangmaiensis NBRC 101099]|uniref:Uncharacterized protein n=1 Tax=Neoasaia chiangmaiensis TaxID=320497 RepID=A0A1U9KPW8_9PROT|nr:helix-turn-helix domain-containing protein [Neoasaia chiangmaiensis]AQS87815.1 hypothetical protein A0U93_07545 [Neoasaia chiangmaiensis]GBR41469.1 hypothetical protein AA101099_2499 [Neoasaia chiangmaiensis NBRC 101099]GEN14425.1 hypothetical protein NCH01_08560 [Neoasaia chiangmaiensis]